jgi:hypothetical protein
MVRRLSIHGMKRRHRRLVGRIIVTVNGEDVTMRCQAFDARQGWARCVERVEDWSVRCDGWGEPIITTLRGRVRATHRVPTETSGDPATRRTKRVRRTQNSPPSEGSPKGQQQGASGGA